jgi:hypothetical protein
MDQKIVKSRSKQQTLHETLLQEIEAQKALHLKLKKEYREAELLIETELRPLVRKELESQKKRILRLDELATKLGVSKAIMPYFEQFMVQEAENLILRFDQVPAELSELYQKHAGQEFKMYRDAEKQTVKEIKSEDQKINSDTNQYKNKDTELQKITYLKKDTKSVYLKLIKKYHPDKVQDMDQKKQYTAISTKITKAYQSNDFLELLKLKNEHLDEQVSEKVDEMLKRYNKILQQQIKDMKGELETLKTGPFACFFDKNYTFDLIKFNKTKKDLKKPSNP